MTYDWMVIRKKGLIFCFWQRNVVGGYPDLRDALTHSADSLSHLIKLHFVSRRGYNFCFFLRSWLKNFLRKKCFFWVGGWFVVSKHLLPLLGRLGGSSMLLLFDLPLVFLAITTAESVVLGILKSVQDGLVLAVEWNTENEKWKFVAIATCWQGEWIVSQLHACWNVFQRQNDV